MARRVLVVGLFAVTIVIAIGVGGRPSGAAPPLWFAPPRIGTGAGTVGALGVGGSTVVYALDRGNASTETCSALRVWSIRTGRTFAPTKPDCNGEFSGYGDVAVAGKSVVWSTTYETNHVLAYVYAAAASNAGRPRRIRQRDWGDVTYDAYIGSLAADGAVVSFSTQAGEYTGGADASLWAGNTHSARIIRHVTGWMDDVAVEGQLVAVGYRNGRVEVFRRSGQPVRSFPPGTAPRGIEFDAGRLVTLSMTAVSIRALDSPRIFRFRQLVRPGKGVQLEDADAGVVVYQAGHELRLLRLSDGHDVRLPVPRAPAWELHARFGKGGLVVAYPHIVKLISWPTLRGLLSTR